MKIGAKAIPSRVRLRTVLPQLGGRVRSRRNQRAASSMKRTTDSMPNSKFFKWNFSLGA
jgi:hypothetical protein